MRLPKVNSFCRVYWQDAQAADGWTYGGTEREHSIEVSSGVYRGLSAEGRVIVDPTVTVGLTSGAIHGELSEIEIPIGCVVKVEKLPPADLTNIKLYNAPTGRREKHG